MMAFLLTVEGHDVRTARDGPSGLAAAREFLPQVVLCDIGLPQMDGYEVAALLRDDPALQYTRLIALTGYGQSEDRTRAKEAGFDYHLTKPVEPKALSEMIGLLRATGLSG